jgi:hypothetical protein
MKMLARLGIWAGCLVLAAALFSAALGVLTAIGSIWIVFRVTLTMALPVWCLYLPFVVFLKDAEGPHLGILLAAGFLIGPAAVLGLSVFQIAHGADPGTVWHGDPLVGVGGAAGSIFAAIVGGITSALYVFALRATGAGRGAGEGA